LIDHNADYQKLYFSSDTSCFILRNYMIFILLHVKNCRCWNPAPPCGQPLTGVIAFGSDHGLCGRFNEVLAVLLREWFFVELFRVCAEPPASEHASRLPAMQAAERNITDRLADLNTVYRQQRQEAVGVKPLNAPCPLARVWRETGILQVSRFGCG